MTANVSFIPPHVPFLETLAQRLISQNTPLSLAQHTIFLPTRRACEKFAELLCALSAQQSTLLPTLIPLGGIDEEELALQSLEQNPEKALISKEKRLILLTQMVQEFHQERHNHLKTSQACLLASSLLSLIDQVQTEGLVFENLQELVPEDYAAHWQITLEFLEVIREEWPKKLDQAGYVEPALYQRQLLEKQSRLWEENPPLYPVIGAGSTGTIPATANLLKTIAYLPKGMVILPGLDSSLEEEVSPTHPQHNMQNLCTLLDVAPQNVPCFTSGTTNTRSQILREIFQTKPRMIPKECITQSLEYLSLAECSNTQEESTTIALSIREQLEDPKKTIALITPDRELSRRVIGELKRWNIRANDSAGTPFTKTPLSVFCLLVADWVQNKIPDVTLLATLKHPYANTFKRFAQTLEKTILRKQKPLASFITSNDEFSQQHNCIQAYLEEGKVLSDEENLPFKTLLSYHKKLLNFLSNNDPSFLQNEAGTTLQSFWESLEAAPDLTLKKGEDFSQVLRQFLAPLTVRERYALHPRLSILGLIEARLIPADYVILGGLNEDTWPQKIKSDPWFSQSMRKKFGLPDHERRTGLSSLDFIHGISAKEVLLTRSLRAQGTPTVPSRLLTRLNSYLKRFDLEIPKNTYLPKLTATFHQAQTQQSIKAPQPKPTIEARPKKLSITDITTLMHAPYSIYAKYVLKLKPLGPLDHTPGPLEYGIFLHSVLEAFVQEGAPSEERLHELGLETFEEDFAESKEKVLWWHRFQNSAHWLAHTFQQNPLPKKHWVEIVGSLSWNIHGQPFTLTAKADRMDAGPEGITIIDYKTGTPPSNRDLEKGLAPQLPLEALIVQEGGFEPVKKQPVSELSFWHLSGGIEGGAQLNYTKNIGTLIEETKQGLHALVEAFYDPQTPYLSTPYQRGIYDDYHHLARIKEWNL